MSGDLTAGVICLAAVQLISGDLAAVQKERKATINSTRGKQVAGNGRLLALWLALRLLHSWPVVRAAAVFRARCNHTNDATRGMCTTSTPDVSRAVQDLSSPAIHTSPVLRFAHWTPGGKLDMSKNVFTSRCC